MKRFERPAARGFSLVVAMIVVVLLTLLVVGAIAFTGTERTAAAYHTREEDMSSCVEAARNMFLAQVRVLQPGSVVSIVLDGGLGPNLTLRTGHFADAGVSIQTVSRLADSVVGAAASEASDLTNRPGSGGQPGYYRVTAVCQESGGPQREVEFAVRVGI